MKRYLIPMLLILSACSSATKESSSPEGKEPAKEVIPLSGSFKVNRYTFENGLRLLVVEDHSSPTFAYQTWFKVGSRDEVVGRTGLAHLFEHMMFKGTKTLKDGEFDKILEGAGAEGENAFTSRDFTAYIQELPKDKLDLIAKVESDRMVNLVVDDHGFKTEREVVQNERRFRNENSPDGLMDQELFALAFKEHSYRWPVVGYQEDLQKMTSENAMEFYRAHYSPGHATVIVVGDVDPDEVKSVVNKYYGNLGNLPLQDHVIAQEPEQTSPRRKQLKLNIQVEKLYMGYHVPGVLHEDNAALEVLQVLLSGGKSSRLHRALVETGIATSAEAAQYDSKDPSLFGIEVNLQKGKHASQAEAIVLKEITKMGSEPVSDQELSRVRNRMAFDYYENLNSDYEKAAFLGQYEAIAGNFVEGIRQHDKMQQVTATDVQRVVKKYFNPKNRSVVTGVKK